MFNHSPISQGQLIEKIIRPITLIVWVLWRVVKVKNESARTKNSLFRVKPNKMFRMKNTIVLKIKINKTD